MEEHDGTVRRSTNTASSSSRTVVDLYCHEAPLVSTPESAARGIHGDHQRQQAQQDLHLLDDNEDETPALLTTMMAKQRCYAPRRGYLASLTLSSSGGLSLSCARSAGVHYIVYAFGRLNLAAATAFNAVNYLDRFLSINCHIHRWETWMVELVSLACLSVACKLDEVNIPSIHHLQMEEVMSHSFRPATIRDMELTLLKALQWRLACVTPFSFLQLFLPLTTTSSCIRAPAASRCTRLLVRSLSEASLLQFDPSVIASSALRCVVLQDHHQQPDVSGHISFLTRPDQCPLHNFLWSKQDKDTDECFNAMKALYASLEMQSDHQRSPISVITLRTDDDKLVSRSSVSRRLFARSTPLVSTEDEDSSIQQPDTAQRTKQ